MSKDNNEVFYHKNGKLVHYTKKDNGSTIEQAIKDKYNKSKRKKPLNLSKDEYGMVVHEINSWYHSRYENEGNFVTCIGDNFYYVINNGFNDYIIYKKKPITSKKRKNR